MKIISLIIILLWETQAYALVGAGGYVPFGFSTQKKAEGGTDPFGFEPMVALNASVKLGGNHFFLPELGYVKHSSLHDGYTKSTIFLLYDFGYLLGTRMMIRYGIGNFITRISGKGQEIEQRNGSNTAIYYAPPSAVTSHNATLNLGGEFGLSSHFAIKAEGYLFSFLSSVKRDLSYSLSLNYYL